MQYIFLSGEIGWEITLQSIEKKFKELPEDEKDVTIYVNSIGGSAYDGIAIYNFLKLKQKEGYNITTVSTGITASAGTLIYVAGNKMLRKTHNTSAFLIHNAWTMSVGDNDDIKKVAEELEIIDSQIADIYAAETNLTKEQALEFMKEDKVRDAEWMKEHGFASEIITYEAVATKRNLNCKINNKMADVKLSKEDKSWLETMFNKLGKVFQPKNKIETTGDGKELDFYELEPDETPKVGDMANEGDKPAEGEYAMPDGTVYVFVSGELTEIRPASDDSEVQELKDKIAELEGKLTEKENAIGELENKLKEAKETFAKIQSKFKLDANHNPDDGKLEKENKIRNRKLF